MTSRVKWITQLMLMLVAAVLHLNSCDWVTNEMSSSFGWQIPLVKFGSLGVVAAPGVARDSAMTFGVLVPITLMVVAVLIDVARVGQAVRTPDPQEPAPTTSRPDEQIIREALARRRAIIGMSPAEVATAWGEGPVEVRNITDIDGTRRLERYRENRVVTYDKFGYVLMIEH